MNVRITQWLDAWNPWRLRKRIKELDESLDRLTDLRDELDDSARRFVLDENKRLEAEKAELARVVATEKSSNFKLRTKLHEIGKAAEAAIKETIGNEIPLLHSNGD